MLTKDGSNPLLSFAAGRERICAKHLLQAYEAYRRSLTNLYTAIEGNPTGSRGDAFTHLSLILLNIKKIDDGMVKIVECYKEES